MPGIIEELRQRGLLEQISDETLAKTLQTGCIPFYAGFDPTAKSLQIGNLCTAITMRRLQEAGHKPVAIVGGATGMIGDPSGKSSERNLLDAETLAQNLAAARKQLESVLDFDCGEKSAIVLNNHDWLGNFTFIEFLRDVGKRFRLGEMLAKESVKRRLESPEGMSFTEFSYQMLQAYDFLYLYEKHKVRLQIGGSDQWGNITAGIDLVRKAAGGQAYGLVIPLITDSQGRKFGKSEGNAIYLDPEMTSPLDMYQYLVNSDDESVIRYLKAFTFFTLEEIAALAEESKARPEKRVAQKALAFELVRMVHGEAVAQAAEKAALDNFRADSLRTSLEGTGVELLATYAGTPADSPASETLPTTATLAQTLTASGTSEYYRTQWKPAGNVPAMAPKGQTISDVTVPEAELAEGVNVIDLFVRTPLFSSKGEARRMIQQGGAYVNDEAVKDIDQTIGTDDLQADGTIALRKGKKRRCVIRPE